MNFDKFKEKMDAYFATLSPQDVVRMFEESGVELEPFSEDDIIWADFKENDENNYL